MQDAIDPPAFRQFFSVWSNDPLAEWLQVHNLQDFNIFFDDVYIEAGFEPINFEVLKQHVFGNNQSDNTVGSGWRIASDIDGWSFAGGDEVQATQRLRQDDIDWFRRGRYRRAFADMRLSPYVATGVRSMNFQDSFYFLGTGSILGRTSVLTQIDHRVIGPELGFGVVAESGMLRFEATAIGLVGYGDAEAQQRGIFGEDLIPGALNRPSTGRVVTPSRDHLNLDSFAAVHGELRLKASCQLTQQLRLDALWVGATTGPIYRAADATAWNAPDFGIEVGEKERVRYDNWFLGLTYTH